MKLLFGNFKSVACYLVVQQMFVFVIEYVCMVTVGVGFGEWDMKVPTFQLVIQHIYIMYNGLVMDYCVHFKLVQHLYNIPTL